LTVLSLPRIKRGKRGRRRRRMMMNNRRNRMKKTRWRKWWFFDTCGNRSLPRRGKEMNQTRYFDSDFCHEEWAEECASRYNLPEIGKLGYSKENGSNFSQDWEDFYRVHDNGQFFKSRKYLAKEFQPWLERSHLLMEVGCGYGCSIYPLLDSFPNLNFIATDYSATALEIFQQNRRFDSSRILIQQWDVTLPCPVTALGERQIDSVLLIFALSAVHPSDHLTAMRNLYKALPDGSVILFRDYGVNDLTMYRHTIRHSEYLFERSDGTLSFYFDLASLLTLAQAACFSVLEMKYATVINKNRKSGVEMRRVFVHAVFRKIAAPPSPRSEALGPPLRPPDDQPLP
jgi:SAM-dependent methyltransferase